MGCGTSKQQPVCRNCQEPLSPMSRSQTMHVHHLPQREGDDHHVVALTSTTLGSFELDSFNLNHQRNDVQCDDIDEEDRNKDFSRGMIEAKSWSKMIDEKIPKVIPRTPPGEPEVINAWELMEGLEDTSPVHHHHHFRSFSFDLGPNSVQPSTNHRTKKVYKTSTSLPKPLWMKLEENDSESESDSDSDFDETSLVPDFDPDVIKEFRKALEELPPANPFHLKPFVDDKQQVLAGNDEALDITDFKKTDDYEHGVFVKEKLVLYFTSLRGVRKTYEDCCRVRVILKGLNVKVDERDVSMHSKFKEELKELLGDGYSGGGGLPRVYVGKKFIGGADEIRRMNDEGQLQKMLQGCEMVEDDGGLGGGGVCGGCGDVRFVPCETCSGSCKIYYEVEFDEDEECEEGEYGFQRCPDCNENGLIRCRICCD